MFFPSVGKKINVEFEAAVLARCMELVATKALVTSETLADDDKKPGFTAELLANALYKYDVVVLAAQEELKDKRWDNNHAVKKCVILHCYAPLLCSHLFCQLCDYFFGFYLHFSQALFKSDVG